MDVRLNWTDCDEAGDYVVPNVLSSMDLVSNLTTWTKLYYTSSYRFKLSIKSEP